MSENLKKTEDKNIISDLHQSSLHGMGGNCLNLDLGD